MKHLIINFKKSLLVSIVLTGETLFKMTPKDLIFIFHIIIFARKFPDPKCILTNNLYTVEQNRYEFMHAKKLMPAQCTTI